MISLNPEKSFETIASQLQAFATTADENARHKLIKMLRETAAALERPRDTILRLVYAPSELAMLQVGVDTRLFHHLVEAGKPVSVQYLAEKCGADPELLGRVCRFLASFQDIKEDAENTFSATKVTEVLTEPGSEGGIAHQFYFVNKMYEAMPGWLKETGYKNPSDPHHAAFQTAYNTDELAFTWWHKHPKVLENFMKWMSDYHKGRPSWTSVVPFAEHMKDWTAGEDRPLFVDVGGSMGMQCVEFKRAIGEEVSGRIVLEDLPGTLEAAPPLPGVDKLPLDFFQPQPMEAQKARYYYFRNVLHNHPDEACVKIVKNIKDAMQPDSRILINEIVVPNQGAHSQATTMDITMMSAVASMERTERQWHELLEGKCGLKIKNLRTYDDPTGQSIIECVIH